jgi:hypothetical protein
LNNFERGFIDKMAAVTGSTLLGTMRGIKSGLRGVEKPKSMQTTVARATPPSLPTPIPVNPQYNLSAKLPDTRATKVHIPKPVKQSGKGIPSVAL